MHKLGQAIKVWWMIFWRAAFIEPIVFAQATIWPFVIAIAVASITVFAFGMTIRIFPIINRLRGKNVFIRLDEGDEQTNGFQSGVGKQVQQSPVQSPIPTAGGHISPGGSQQHTPRTLETVPEPMTPNMYGKPGKSLATARGMSAANASAGALGERNFAKILAVEGLINRCVSLWSVKMPGKIGFSADPVLNTDIDCILFYDNTVLLLDMKLYTGGDITYHSTSAGLMRVDNQTGQTAGAPIKMSQNMQIAHERFTRLYPRQAVYAMVVFIPTDRGSATLNNVVWPGNIPAVNLDEMISYLHDSLPQHLGSINHARLALPLLA